MSQKIKNIFISIGSSKKALYAIMAVVILAIVIPVLATYTGPNRTIQEKECHDVKIIDGCNYTGDLQNGGSCTLWVGGCVSQPGSQEWVNHCGDEVVNGSVDEEVVFHWEEDCKWVTVAAPPATVNGSVSCTNGTNGWCRSDATLNITGSDPNPANTIIAIEGTRNGTDFACASDTCQIDATSNGSFAFEYWAVSSYGDTSYKGNTTITVDKEAPVVGLNLSGSMGYNSWYVSGVSWTTSLTDNVSGPSHAEVSVDGTAQSNPGSYTADGSHTIKATGYDNAGNSSQTQQTIQIDQTNPVPAYTLNGSLGTNGWYTNAVSWNASATDATSGVYAVATQLDGASVNNSASIGTNGTHTLQVTAQDNAGNLTSTSGSFKIDQEDPFISLNLSGTQGTHSWYTGPVSWSSTASDTVSGLVTHTATLNGSTTTVNGSVNSDGTYTLIASAQDNASNQSTQTRTFGIDQSAPTVSMNPISGTQNNTVQLSGNSTDATSGVSYVEISIAGQTHQVNTTGAWSYQWNSTSACNGSVTASVRSVDQAGNVSASTTQTFTVQNTPTTLTLPTQTDASNPVVFNLNTSNLNQMVIRISDDAGNLPAVTHTFTGTSIPSSYRWDRYMGDGSLAPKGTYTMNVRIYDKNTCTTDTASITLVVTESILSAWVSGAPTNTPIPPQFTPTEPANLREDQIGQVESESFQTSLTPTIETTATDDAVVVLPTETPTSTPTTTPNPNPFVLPKADQKTTTSTSSSPKAPDTTPAPDPNTLSTGVLIGTAAAGLIGSIAAYQVAVETERKRKEAEAKKQAEELMRKKQLLAKGGFDTYQMNTNEIDKLYKENEKSIRQKVQEEKIAMAQAEAKEAAKREAWIAAEKIYLEALWAQELEKRKKIEQSSDEIGSHKALYSLNKNDEERELTPEEKMFIQKGIILEEEIFQNPTIDFSSYNGYLSEDELIEIYDKYDILNQDDSAMLTDLSAIYQQYVYYEIEEIIDIYTKNGMLQNVLLDTFNIQLDQELYPINIQQKDLMNSMYTINEEVTPISEYEAAKTILEGVLNVDKKLIEYGSSYQLVFGMEEKDILSIKKGNLNNLYGQVKQVGKEIVFDFDDMENDKTFEFNAGLVVHELGHIFDNRMARYMEERGIYGSVSFEWGEHINKNKLGILSTEGHYQDGFKRVDYRENEANIYYNGQYADGGVDYNLEQAADMFLMMVMEYSVQADFDLEKPGAEGQLDIYNFRVDFMENTVFSELPQRSE